MLSVFQKTFLQTKTGISTMVARMIDRTIVGSTVQKVRYMMVNVDS